MRLLLDTHTLLWFLADDQILSATAKSALVDPGNERLLSPISLVEIALKVRLGKLTLSAPFGILFPAQLTVNRITLLPMRRPHRATDDAASPSQRPLRPPDGGHGLGGGAVASFHRDYL